MSEQFWSKVAKTDGCWEWQGSLTSAGYGRTSVNGKTVFTHRYSYEQIVGPIPEGLVIDHLCRNRSCCNPGHLEPVTNRENVLRGIGPSAINARKTHCPEGHELFAANVYVAPGTRERHCRTCLRRHDRMRKDGLIAKRAEENPRTHCANGHEWTEENTMPRSDSDDRRCRTCRTAYERERQVRRTAARRAARAAGGQA